MRVLGVLAAWGVLAVLATLCFAVGGSIGYRRGVQDAVRQLRERRNGKAGCRPMPLPYHRHRPATHLRLRNAVRPRTSVTTRPKAAGQRARRIAGVQWSPAVVGALVAVSLLTVPGVALGATAAQPGDTLWKVKRGMEQARLVMAVGPSRDAVIHAELAVRRLTELNQLLSTGGADPQVVDMVITGLHDHTESATSRLKETAVRDRQAVAQRLDDVVERQITVIDLLLGVDCAQSVNQQCVALTDTREASEELQRTTTAIAAADGVSGEVPQGPAVTSEQALDAIVGAAPSEAASALPAPDETTQTPTEEPSASASPAPSDEASATPTAPETETGDGTSETADDGSSDTPPDPSREPSSSNSGGGSTASGAADTIESELKQATDTAEQATDNLIP
jgi:hypothetical protein